MQQVDWLVKEKYGRKFIKKLVESDDCQPLFKTKAVQDIVGNLWRISRSYFVYNYFLTYFFLDFLPVVVMAIMISAMEKSGSGIGVKVVFYIFAALFLIGTFFNVHAEVKQLISTRFKEYFTDL